VTRQVRIIQHLGDGLKLLLQLYHARLWRFDLVLSGLRISPAFLAPAPNPSDQA
jgi:hypothetical protein